MQIVESARTDFAAAQQNAALEDAKAKYIGKNGAITALMRGLAGLTPEQKRERGPAINKAKAQVEALLNARREELADAAMQAKLAAEAVDVTLPGRRIARGGIHPVIRTWMRIEEIFASIGFDVADGPEIESDWYSFTALNNPPNHPARCRTPSTWTVVTKRACSCRCVRIPHRCRCATPVPIRLRSK